MKFLVCSTDEDTFNLVIGTSPVVGTHERFVVPMDIYFDDLSDEVPFEYRQEEMLELGIDVHSIV